MAAATAIRATEREQPHDIPPPIPRWERIAAFAGAVVLAALYARLTVTHMGEGIVGGYFNGYENIWNNWWLRESLLHLHTNPFYTTYAQYPVGVSLRYHTLAPFGGLLALPLTPLMGYVAAMNVKFLAALVGCGFFAYLLARDHVESGLAAFAGATLYPYANWLFISFYTSAEENYLLGSALLPLYFFLALRAAHRPRWRGYAAAAIAALLALCLTDWQFTLFAVLLTLLSALWSLTALATRGGRTRVGWARVGRVWGRFALIGGAWVAIIAAPLLLPMLAEAEAHPYLAVNDQTSSYALPLDQFFRLGGTANPGYLVLAVCAIGLLLIGWRGTTEARRAAGFWIFVATVGCVLALGPVLKLTPDNATGIPLPYALWYRLPVLNIGRKPQLWYATFGSLAFALLAALAFAALLSALLPALGRVLARRPRFAALRVGRVPLVRAVPGFIVAALLVPTLAPFFAAAGDAAVQPPEWPAFYRDVLAHDPEQYAILELPIFPGKHGLYGGTYAAYQSIHGKYRFGASLSRDQSHRDPDILATHATFFRDCYLLDEPKATDLFRPTKTPDFLATPDYATIGVPLLREYNVRYIVLSLDALDSTPTMIADAESLVRAALGANVQPAYADARLRAYRVPDAPPDAPRAFLDTGATGWYAAQLSEDKTPYRWADTGDGNAATLLAQNLTAAPQRVTVQMTVYNYRSAREVSIALDDATLQTFALAPGEAREIDLPITLPPGLHTLTLTTPQAAVPVETTGKSRDSRLLSFGVRGVRLV